MAVVDNWACPNHRCTGLSGIRAGIATTLKPCRSPFGLACAPLIPAACITALTCRHARDPTFLWAEALWQGMLAVMARAQGKTAYFAHPYAWAPFMLVGEGGRGKP